MGFEHYVRSGTRLLRSGYTTGTCAALAAVGAAQLLLTGKAPDTVSLMTPKGLRVETPLEDCRYEDDRASCAVRKDAGDDPDVTDGILVYATVTKARQGIRIDGGQGVGRVTKPGLDQPVGAAAINTVPRRMISAAVKTLCEELGYDGGMNIVISVPGGEERAKKTLNPMLGIEGGISILGTSGLVEPMSEQAIVDTIAVEIRQAAAAGGEKLLLTPGNYGMDFIEKSCPELAKVPRIKCSNYIGEAVDIAVLEGFCELLLVGHVGKMVKLAGGIMNTHSKIADCRRELFCAHAVLCGADRRLCRQLMEQVTTDGCLALLDSAGLRESVLESLLDAIQRQLDRRTAGQVKTGAILFSNAYGQLGMTEGAGVLLRKWSDVG